MLAVIDYGVGNLFSLKSSLQAVHADAEIAASPETLEKADGIILPGVGAFADAADKLRNSGLAETLIEETEDGKPLMGICLGMQMLFEKSMEYGEHQGLGFLKGCVRPLDRYVPESCKIPHIGWNSLSFTETGKKSPLFRNTKPGSYVYFVHSYYAADCDESVLATAEYGVPVTAAVGTGNVYGCQFHPEKSGDTGLRILKSFAEVCQ